MRICQERKGEARVLFDLERKGDFTVVMEAEGYNVLPDRAFINRVEELCGRGSVRVHRLGPDPRTLESPWPTNRQLTPKQTGLLSALDFWMYAAEAMY